MPDTSPLTPSKVELLNEIERRLNEIDKEEDWILLDLEDCD